MTSTKLGIGIAALAMAGAIGTYVRMEHANAKLRSEVVALQNQTPLPTLAAPQPPSATTPATDADELATLRAEHEETDRDHIQPQPFRGRDLKQVRPSGRFRNVSRGRFSPWGIRSPPPGESSFPPRI
jgi:hypothetical protein